MQTFLQDLRYALRQLRKSPAFTWTSVLSLALGIGATTAVFSVVYAVLMNPYPYRDAERMVHIFLTKRSGGDWWPGLTGNQIRQLRQVRSLEGFAAQEDWNLTTTDGDVPDDIAAMYLTGNAFDYFGVAPALGRGLIPSDAPEGQDPQPVVVLGYAFWQRRYNGDSQVAGKTIQLAHKTLRHRGRGARPILGRCRCLSSTEADCRSSSSSLRFYPSETRSEPRNH